MTEEKALLLRYLKDLAEIVEKSDDGVEAWRQMRRESFLFPFLDEHFDSHLRHLNNKLDALLDRPPAFCRMASPEGEGALQLMVGVGARARSAAITHLRNELAGANELAICDPYLLRPDKGIATGEYVDGIAAAIPDSVKRIEVYVKPRQRDAEVAKGFNELCRQRGIRTVCRRTNALHDRVWIANWQRAYSVGTSFNGLGNKCSFILEIPEEDRRNFLRELVVLRENTPKSNSV